MYEIIFTKKYEKKAKNFLKKHQDLKKKYKKTILLLKSNPFYPSLRLHKLKDSLSKFYSVSIDMEYRIIVDFIIIDEKIILIDVGNYDEVY
jgi:mRNA-degrading endonuclease YafQ of YafQ-DinJ toxin-antitoxin module